MSSFSCGFACFKGHKLQITNYGQGHGLGNAQRTNNQQTRSPIKLSLTSKKGWEIQKGVKEENENISIEVRSIRFDIHMRHSIAMHHNFEEGERWYLMPELPYKCNCYVCCAEVFVLGVTF